MIQHLQHKPWFCSVAAPDVSTSHKNVLLASLKLIWHLSPGHVSQVMIKAWIMPVMAVCKGFPTLPHKGGLAERQRVFRHCLPGPGPPAPPRCPTVSQTMRCYNSCFAPQPPILFTQPRPSLLPPPTLWTQGVVTWCFLSGECGLLVNSWAAIHSFRASQVKTRRLRSSTLQQEGKGHEYRTTDRVLTNVCILMTRSSQRRPFCTLSAQC